MLFCDGLIAFWDLGCCLLVLCAYLTRYLILKFLFISADNPEAQALLDHHILQVLFAVVVVLPTVENYRTHLE